MVSAISLSLESEIENKNEVQALGEEVSGETIMDERACSSSSVAGKFSARGLMEQTSEVASTRRPFQVSSSDFATLSFL